MDTYLYRGPVSAFNKLLNSTWSAKTRAPSKNKALSNLTCQYKRANGIPLNSKIELNPKLITKGAG